VSREWCEFCVMFFISLLTKKRGQTWVIVLSVYSFMNKEMQEDTAQLSEYYRK